MSTNLKRRGLLTSGLLGAAALGAAPIASAAESAVKHASPDEEYDVVVIGAGPGGLVTAITAHDAGAKSVIVLMATPSSPWALSVVGVPATRPNKALRIRPKTSTP